MYVKAQLCISSRLGATASSASAVSLCRQSRLPEGGGKIDRACGFLITFDRLASPILERFWVNVPHMKALVTRIQNLLLLLKYDYRWLKHRLKLLRNGFLRSFAGRGRELKRVELVSWPLADA